MGSKRISHPRFRREGAKPRVELTDDDAAILRHVYRHRFIRAEDLYRLFGERSADRLSRRLTLLYRAGFLDRPIAQIDRYTQGGSHSIVYGLDSAGARHLKEVLGVPIGAADWRSRNRSYTRESLDHTLAVARFLVDLEIACRAQANLSLLKFDDILAASPDATRRSRNPTDWQVPIQWYGGKAVVNIAPDAIFGLRMQREDGQFVRSYFFVEIDRSTMTIVPSERVRESEAFPYRATILRKLYAYADSYRLKLHEQLFGMKAPRVLFLTTSESRAEAMRKTAEQFIIRPMRLPAGIFLFASHTNRLDMAIWQAVDGDGKETLILPA
jgi:Replication-relaxation